MKLSKLFLLPILTLLLAGCGNSGDSTHGTGLNSSTEPASEPTSSSEEEKPTTYFDTGSTVGFPAEQVNNFLTIYGLNYYVPAVGEDTTEWDYNASYDMFLNAYLEIGCEDKGTPGTDALEDQFKTLVEAQGWTVDDSDYDSDGYYVLNEAGEDAILFYSYMSEFYLRVYGPQLSLEDVGYSKVQAFPTTLINSYLKDDLELDVIFPAVSSDQEYYYMIDNGSFSIIAEDKGTVGVDSLEDVVKAALDEAEGWTVDDSNYESEGYYAYYEGATDLEVLFYSYEGEFDMWVYVNTPTDVE